MIQQAQNQQTVEDDDDDLTDMAEKHPYVQACFDKEFINKRYLVKNINQSRQKVAKDKNVLSDLPDPLNYQMFNGVQFQLSKVFGQYQSPIQKSIHFISNNTVIFFVGNYLAVHNLFTDETKYVGIEQNLADITCFEVQTIDAIVKGEYNFNNQQNQKEASPSKQPNLLSGERGGHQSSMNTLSGLNDNNYSSPLQLNANTSPNNFGGQNAQNQVQNEFYALIVIAEKAKESYAKEQKFSMKKVFGITSQNRKKGFHRTQSPTHQNLSSPNIQGGLASNIQGGHSDEQQILKYIVKVNIFHLSNPNKRYVLQHIFDEYFTVQQIYIRDKDSFCYSLCANQKGEQLFFIWNFRKETIMAHTELKAKINKFNVSPHKNEVILFLGQSYLKYHEATFTDKSLKVNGLNLVSMKIEKESNFVDIEYLNKSDLFVIISDFNHVFIFEKNALKIKLTSGIEELNKQSDSVVSDTLEIGDLSDKEQFGKEEEHLIIPNVGSQGKQATQNQQKKQQQTQNYGNKLILDMDNQNDVNLREMPSDNEESQDQINQKGQIEFQKILVTQKGFMIGGTNAYFFYYEFQKEEQPPKLLFQVHLSKRIRSFMGMSISRGTPKNEEYLVALTGVYHKSNQAGFLPHASFDGGFSQKKQMMGTQKNISSSPKNQLQINSKDKVEERIEYLVVNLRSIQTQQLNKIVQKIYNKGAHDGSIYQVVEARHKSWLYTISEGQNLKVWSHSNEWNGVANYYFNEQPICVDVHPSSWQICLGFKSGIKIYQNLDRSLKLMFEKLGKAAFALKYSDGGQYLACVNSINVDIIDPIRTQVLCTLAGHQGLVKTLNWTPNSKYLISTCNNGGILLWKGNFKEQIQNQQKDIIPIASQVEKNYQYLYLCIDEELDIVFALTHYSTLRIFSFQTLECMHEENLLSLQNCQENLLDLGIQQNNQQLYQNQANLKALSISFSKYLGILAVGYSNGKIGIVSWPLAPNKRAFKYDIMLQRSSITDLMFTFNSKFLVCTTDDGNIYILESFKIIEGQEKNWLGQNQEYQNLKKKREQNGLRGACITDNIIMCNKSQLEKVNKKIDKLELQIKTYEVNYKIKVAKKLKKFEKQKKLIDRDLQESLDKQAKLVESLDTEFEKDMQKLNLIYEQQKKNNEEEKGILTESKQQNLAFVNNENDELENKILRLKQTIVNELEKIEEEHAAAVLELAAQDEVKNTIDKLKSNGSYYEGMLVLQEKDYEKEILQLQGDLIDENHKITTKKQNLENQDNTLKKEYMEIEENYKVSNHGRKQKIEEVKRLNFEHKNQETNLERLVEKEIQSNMFINEKESAIQDQHKEKKQLENLIIFLSTKIKELKDERKPLEEKKRQMETIIEETYRELQDDFQFRQFMELKEESLIKKMDIIHKEIQLKIELNKEILEKFRIFKRELSYLKDAKVLKGWILKIQGILTCMNEVQNCQDPEEVKKVSMEFIHIAEIMESNSRPYRVTAGEDEVVLKQARMNEVDLAYHRNKSSQKLIEMKFRYKQLFKQMEKQISKLRLDNVKLIEEFNTLQNEHKKLNNLRKMIKESIKELMGDEFEQQMVNSSDEDSFKKKKKPIQQNSIGNLNRSKSTHQLTKGQSNLQNTQALTARDLYQSSKQLPDLKSKRSVGGSLTQRDNGGTSDNTIHLAGGFIMKSNQKQQQSIKNSISHKSISSNTVGKIRENRKYLDKIVEEFEKNRKQIEQQNANMQNIQNQMNLLINSSVDLSKTQKIPSQYSSQFQQSTNLASGQPMPLLNLAQISQLAKSGIYSGKQTVTTRIPMSTDRTTTLSTLEQGSNHNNLSAIKTAGTQINLNQKLPVIKESEFSTNNIDLR